MTDATPSVQTQAAAAAAVVAVATVDQVTGTPVAPVSELNAIEAKLSLYLHAVETRYEADVAKVKSTFSALKANWLKLTASHLFAGGIGAVGAAVVKHFL